MLALTAAALLLLPAPQDGELDEEGRRTGTWRWRDAEGELRVKGRYTESLRSGKWTFRYASGEKRAEGVYREGRKHGNWTYWTEEGGEDPLHSGEYRFVEGRDAFGEPRHRGHLLDGALHGAWTFFWDSGRPMLQAEFLRGRRAGTWRFHHEDGSADPGFLRIVHRGAHPHLGIELEPLPEAEWSGVAAQPVAEPARIEPDLALLGDLEPVTAPTEEERRRIAELVERGGPAAELVAIGRAAFPHLVNELKELDLAQEADVLRGAELQTALAAIANRSFGWRTGTEPEDVRANRIAVLRWHSLYAIFRDVEEYWEIDARVGRGPAAEPRTVDLPAFPLDVEARVLEQEGVSMGFGARFGGRRNLRATGGAGIEPALKGGLEWLQRHQSDDGSWNSDGFAARCGDTKCGGPGWEPFDEGVTALALLAFLGDGNTTVEGPYRDVVLRGVRYLVARQDPESGLVGAKDTSDSLTEHALATQALAEAAYYSRSPAVRRAAEQATRYLLRARNPYAAWRYEVPPSGDNDTMVTGTVFFALAAATDAGVTVDAAAFDGVLAWIDEATDPANGRVGYDSHGSTSARYDFNVRFPVEKGETMTALGLLCRVFLGQQPKDHPIMEKHADLMRLTLPAWDPEGFGCDMLYWYYGTYAMFQMGGTYWKAWNQAMKKTVLESQRKDGHHAGSWDPVGPWGSVGGRVYSTALMTLCLEVYFRYARVI